MTQDKGFAETEEYGTGEIAAAGSGSAGEGGQQGKSESLMCMHLEQFDKLAITSSLTMSDF